MENLFNEYKAFLNVLLSSECCHRMATVKKIVFLFWGIWASDFGYSMFICTIEYEPVGYGPCSQEGWIANLLYLGTSLTSAKTPLRSEVAVL